MNRNEEIDKVIEWAKKCVSNGFVVFDCESTGLLDCGAEIVSMAVVDSRENVLLNCLVKPQAPIDTTGKAYEINQIGPQEVRHGAEFFLHYALVRALLERNLTIVYNAEFDMSLLAENAKTLGYKPIVPKWGKAHCAMQQYAKLRGVPGRNGWRWFKLTDACSHMQIEVDERAHGALGDCIRTVRLVHAMAAYVNPQHSLDFGEEVRQELCVAGQNF